MERNKDGFVTETRIDRERTVMKSNVFWDHVGEVLLSLDSDTISWELLDSIDVEEHNASTCLGIKLGPKVETLIRLSDVYAVELINWGLIRESILPDAGGLLLGRNSEMYRFTVHCYQRSPKQHSLYYLTAHTFGHRDLHTCQAWVDRITAFINKDGGRPKSLLVFVHPLSGKGNGCRIWESVAPIFSRANVKTKVTVTQKAGHALDVMATIEDMELASYDGVIAVGGDGFFNEILNGLLFSRHKAPYPPAPAEFMHSVGSHLKEDEDSLVQCSEPSGPGSPNVRTRAESCDTEQNPVFPVPNKQFRFGIIPAGSTDAIVICTTGTRDPVTSALHIVLGGRVCLDIAQVVRWKTTRLSKEAPYVRYAASFAGYGFYGDVIRDSEHYRWMGPKRYDYAGTKVFLKHRSYEAEVAYLGVKSEKEDSVSPSGTQLQYKSKNVICRVNCTVCSDFTKPAELTVNGPSGTDYTNPEESRWLRSKGRFLSIGAAVISCRNDRAPDGLVADAHLSDGFLHLVLIKDCPRALYLWHLTQLARKGGNPLNFKFVEHHKTPAFTFTSAGDEGVWNLDGELLQAHQLSAQVFRGLVSLFAPGPEI